MEVPTRRPDGHLFAQDLHPERRRQIDMNGVDAVMGLAVVLEMHRHGPEAKDVAIEEENPNRPLPPPGRQALRSHIAEVDRDQAVHASAPAVSWYLVAGPSWAGERWRARKAPPLLSRVLIRHFPYDLRVAPSPGRLVRCAASSRSR